MDSQRSNFWLLFGFWFIFHEVQHETLYHMERKLKLNLHVDCCGDFDANDSGCAIKK